MIHLRCVAGSCEFTCDPAASNLDQYAQLKHHFDTAHPLPHRKATAVNKKNLGTGIDGLPGHPTATSPSVVDKIWNELDARLATALEWPSVDEHAGPWASADELKIAKLESELANTKAAAAGRGLAIALSLMMPGAYPSSDDVMREAMRRYEARKATASADEAQQVTAPDPACGAAVATVTPVASAPAPVTTPTAAPVATASAATAPASAELSPEQVEAIRTALEGGFDPENLASVFKIPVERIREIAEGVSA